MMCHDVWWCFMMFHDCLPGCFWFDQSPGVHKSGLFWFTRHFSRPGFASGWRHSEDHVFELVRQPPVERGKWCNTVIFQANRCEVSILQSSVNSLENGRFISWIRSNAKWLWNGWNIMNSNDFTHVWSIETGRWLFRLTARPWALHARGVAKLASSDAPTAWHGGA